MAISSSGARASGARFLVPTGALIGLDAVRAAAEGRIHSVRMVTRKPPKAWPARPTSSPTTSRSPG